MIPERYNGYETSVTLGCANFAPVWGDKPRNLDKIKSMVEEAARLGIHILAFPELALSGYESDPEFVMHGALAETIPGPATEEIAALARRHNMYVTFGMPERDRERPERLYIANPLLGPDGLVGTYRKIHIGPPPLFTETRTFTGGTAVPVFETRFGPVGIQICADFWVFPELSRILMLKGARIIVNCSGSASAPDRPYYLRQQTGARATENLVYTATANLTGRERSKSYYGHSTIAGPDYPRFVRIFAEAGEEEEIISASLNFHALHRFRELIRLPEIRRGDVINREFAELESARN
ncbi:MAG: carbon-nitrogen hydrolase family protein [Gammaproteobacteria bacterium]|nr:carbon-nitrogen hydrolase family protein [Gammaproteobacteria bacterium]